MDSCTEDIMRLETILCPIDFSSLSAHELEVAVELGRAFGARLVLHHNRMAIGAGLGRAWDWEASHHAEHLGEGEAEQRMAAALRAVPAQVRAEGVISEGPVGLAVLSVAERVAADLIVVGSHGFSTPEHASVTERLIARAPCPVLSVHAAGGQSQPLRFGAKGGEARPRAVVPTDFSPTARHALDYAYGLARKVPLDLELLHVLPGGSQPSPAAENAAHERLAAAVPDELKSRVATCIRRGEATTEILAHLAGARPQFAVLGEHARDVLRYLFTRDTALGVLHAASCPVWIVPARAAV
jgi:nucleotide-binding universal stress UspA family protein